MKIYKYGIVGEDGYILSMVESSVLSTEENIVELEESFIFDKSFRYRVIDGVVTKENNTSISYLKSRKRLEKNETLSKMTVEYNGNTFQSDDTSQNRLSRNLSVLGDEESINWKTYDNEIVSLNKVDIKEILKLAALKYTEIITGV